MHTFLALVLVPFSGFLPIDGPDHSRVLLPHVGQLVGRVQRVDLSFVQKLLLVVHEVDVLDMHTRVKSIEIHR